MYYLIQFISLFIFYILIFYSSFKINAKYRIYHYLLSQLCILSSFFNYMIYHNYGYLNYHNYSISLFKQVDNLLFSTFIFIFLGKIINISKSNIYMICFLNILRYITTLLTIFLNEWVFIFFSINVSIPIIIFIFKDIDKTSIEDFTSSNFVNRYYIPLKILLNCWMFYSICNILIYYVNNLYFTIFYQFLEITCKYGLLFWLINCLFYSKIIKDYQLETTTISF